MANVYDFIAQIAPLIVAEGTKRGYKIFSTVIAQAIIESRYGQSGLAKYNNFFGLKCGKAWLQQGKPSVVFNTKEEYKVGTLTTIKDAFRVYPDMAAGVAGYYDFISSSRYANLKTATTYRMYAEMLKQDGYATSSSYINTLCDTVTKYGLQAYDHGKVPTTSTDMWVVGKTYTTQQDLNVRRTPNGELVPYEELTPDAKNHAIVNTTGTAILKRGTRVTVKAIEKKGSCTWIQIPSGWVCAANSKAVYVL